MTLTVRLDAAVESALERYCTERGVTKSLVVQECLAGYLLADLDGLDAPERLRRAVAYGSGAAALPGSQLPRPDQTNPADVVVAPVA